MAPAVADAVAAAALWAEVGGCRGEELFDALEVGVLAGGALGARLRLVELRLLWIDWVSNRPSMLLELRCWYWCWYWLCELGGFFVSLRREELLEARLVLFWLEPSMIQRNVEDRAERGGVRKAKRKNADGMKAGRWTDRARQGRACGMRRRKGPEPLGGLPMKTSDGDEQRDARWKMRGRA